jgi:hypothetical protein
LVAKQVSLTNGCGTYTGSLPFFCDPYGADVWTVCVATFTVRVVVEGDISPPPCAAPTATGKKATGKAKQPKPAPRKSISKATAASKKRGGSAGSSSAGIVSVPGLSKKEVAALNKSARASAKRMAAASSDDDW